LAAEGAHVVVDHPGEAEAANEVVQTIQDSGGAALAIAADVSITDAVHNLFRITVQEFGTIDILVNNAGICPFVEWFDLTEDIWDQVHHINL
jgi:NAD(P)-dependent dehydrogenase (short-subunit alcohol dehydrogenase family)